jgi:EmrB/QacA subfamily drug resistance transporter
VITVNLSLLNVGLPTMARQLRASNLGLEWIVDGYALVFAGFLLGAGFMGDRYGGRPVMVFGLTVFAATSLGAGLSHSTAEVIGFRCGMGLGAACVMPITLSVLTDVYETEAGLRRAIGLWASTASGGSVIAPLLAGILLRYFWWGSLFLVNVPLAALTAIAAAVVIPDSKHRRRVRIDWAGMSLSILFAVGLVFSLTEGPDTGWGSPLVLSSLTLTAGSGVLFWWWERRVAEPLIDLRCFLIPRFAVGCGVVSMQYFITFGSGFVVTQYLQLVLGFSALSAGITLMPSAAVLMVVSPYGARAFGRFGARKMIPISLGVAAVGAASLRLARPDSPVGLVLLSMVLISLAVGLMAAGTTSMVMSAVSPAQAGTASGAQSTTRQLGGAVGVAVVGSVLATRYSSSLSTRLSHTVASGYLGQAKRSLADALQATTASNPEHHLVVSAAKASFVTGVHGTATVLAVASLLVAVVVVRVLRPSPAAESASLPGPAPLEPAPAPEGA